MCEDYRAAATIDLVHDRDSRAADRKVQCPMLVLWGRNGKIGEWYDALAIWKNYCSNTVIGGPVNAGHYIAEEAPDETLDWFSRFF
jgi:haloacetate dehalogenase